MTTRTARTLAVALFGFSTLVAPLFAQDTATLERRGEALLSRHCAMCHALGRAGSSPNPIAVPFRELETRRSIASMREALASGLMGGHPDMPRFTFEPREIEEIVAYLRSIQER